MASVLLVPALGKAAAPAHTGCKPSCRAYTQRTAAGGFIAGVIGVNLKIEYMHGTEWMEITAVGTAVKYTGGGQPRHAQPGQGGAGRE